MVEYLARVEQMVGAFAVDETHGEGLCAILTGDQWMPLIAADTDREAFIVAQAEIIAKARRIKVVVARFTIRTDIETFDFR